METLILGIMSGTSCDGVDVAVVAFSPSAPPQLRHFEQFPMPTMLRQRLLELMQGHCDGIETMAKLDRQLGNVYAEAANQTLEKADVPPQRIMAIACHGQTIRHRPEAPVPFSLQIGCAATLAELTGLTVVSDFRRSDIAAGGQGAPLVPFAHRLMLRDVPKPAAVVNIGGIANITWLGKDDTLLGFDCGPGNMVMDGLIAELSNGRQRYDADGALAAKGEISQSLLQALQSLPYFDRPPPKSTGREMFGKGILRMVQEWPNISDADRMRTLLEWTAWAIADAARLLPEPPRHWFVCGGGVQNALLMQRLRTLLHPASVQPTDIIGLPAQAVEAFSFAILAQQALLGRTNVLPEVTGARHASIGGQITPGRNWPEVLHALSQWTR